MSELTATEMDFAHPFNSLIGELVFPYLELRDLLSASMVCKAWKTMTMDNLLWKEIKLNNFMVVNWHKFIDIINERNTMSLCTKDMLLPNTMNEYDHFWINFSTAAIKAKKLQILYLYTCPPIVVENIFETLPQLQVFHALSITTPYTMDDSHNVHNSMNLNLSNLSQLTNLTELKLESYCDIVFNDVPTFESLINLKTFSLTSTELLFDGIWNSLNTISVDLMHLEIGHCENMSEEFAIALKRFVNLTSLKLDNYYCNTTEVTHEIFETIRGLKKLTTLEFINISCEIDVINELEQCDNIRILTIYPIYHSFISHDLIHCFKQLSNTLTHLFIGISYEYLSTIDELLFTTVFHNYYGTLNHVLLLPKTILLLNGDNYINDRWPNENIKQFLLTVKKFEMFLNKMMPNVYILVIREY